MQLLMLMVVVMAGVVVPLVQLLLLLLLLPPLLHACYTSGFNYTNLRMNIVGAPNLHSTVHAHLRCVPLQPVEAFFVLSTRRDGDALASRH